MENTNLEELKQFYSFDSGQFMGFYLSKVSDEIKSFNICCKLNGLIDFLILNFTSTELPKQPTFVYSNQGLGNLTQFKNNLKKLHDNKKFTVKKNDLLSVVQSVYPDVKVVQSYFLNSTFPTIFGNFSFDEYANAALNFINFFSDDPNSHLLTGYFLKYSFFFQEKFIDTFLYKVSQSNEILSMPSLISIFKYSFEQCIPYMSKYQILAAKNLIIKKSSTHPMLVSIAFFNCFLQRIFNVLQVSPKFTDEIRLKVPNGDDTFSKLYDEIQKKEKQFIYNCFLNVDIDNVFTLPKIGDVTFSSSEIVITDVDRNITKQISDFFCSQPASPRRITTHPFKEELFIIHPSEISLNSKNYFEIRNISLEFTQEKLEENVKCREYISERASNLYVARQIFKSAKKVLKLNSRKYSTMIFANKRNKDDDVLFKTVSEFILKLTSNLINKELKFEDYEDVLKEVLPCNGQEMENLKEKICVCLEKMENKIIEKFGRKLKLSMDDMFLDYFCGLMKDISDIMKQ